MGSIVNSWLALFNFTAMPLTTAISGVNNFDWEGERPDGNFNNVQIRAGGSLDRLEQYNGVSKSAWFEITARFANGDVVSWRVEQHDANNGKFGMRTFALGGASANRYQIWQFVPHGTQTNTYILTLA